MCVDCTLNDFKRRADKWGKATGRTLSEGGNTCLGSTV